MSGKVLVWACRQATPNSTVRLVMFTLADIANPSGRLWASTRYVAAKAQLSERSVRDAIRALEEIGLIEVTSRTGSTNDIRFKLTPVTIFGDDDEDLTMAPDSPLQMGPHGRPKTPANGSTGAKNPGATGQGGRQLVPQTPAAGAAKPVLEPVTEPKTSLRSESAARDADLEDDGYGDDDWSPEDGEDQRQEMAVTVPDDPRTPFEQFWDTYPRKAGKGVAVKAFANALKRVELFHLLERTQAFADAIRCWPKAEQVRYCPHPTTWLNRDGWDDDMDDVRIAHGTGTGSDRRSGSKARSLRSWHNAAMAAIDEGGGER